MRYEAQHKGKGRWQVWDNEHSVKVSEAWLDRVAAQAMVDEGNEEPFTRPQFQPEGQDAALRDGLAKVRDEMTKPLDQIIRPLPTPSAKDIGQSIVDHCLTLHDWKPQDWRRIQTAFQYAQRLGGYWGRQTRS